MKIFKWKTYLITSLICLLPVFLGLALWDMLPEEIAIHFNINNEPDNFASKGFAVFGLPILMVILQGFCCFITDFNSHKHGERIKFVRVVKWIIPFMTIVLQIATFGYSLGWNVDIRKVAGIVVGVIFLLIGNYLPKLNYVKGYDLQTQKARKINRFIGFESVIMGVLFLISLFLPTIFTISCIFLLIPYAIIGVIYGVVVAKREND